MKASNKYVEKGFRIRPKPIESPPNAAHKAYISEWKIIGFRPANTSRNMPPPAPVIVAAIITAISGVSMDTAYLAPWIAKAPNPIASKKTTHLCQRFIHLVGIINTIIMMTKATANSKSCCHIIDDRDPNQKISDQATTESSRVT